ncbi:HAD family phosphatase [Ruminococcus sp. FC2018]|uniref:HAD family hydrolase n=1 Tax=Ruminococcus sp. FC2018 TaxID=1410617 RepID=UPI00049082C2|nr:HAD family phosphatase [Ruminococcus sp. FC2018]
MDITHFKGVIFDLDGTLVDSHWVWSQIDIDFLGKRGFEVPADYTKAVSAMDFRQAAIYTKERFGLKESLEEIRNEWRDMAIWHYANDIEAVKGAPEFVRKLHSRGVKLALATASSRELFEPVLKRHGIFDCFDFFATTEQVERGKGYPDIYLFAAKGLGLSRKDCAVFEDIIEGVNGAKAGGFTVFARLNPLYTADREKIISAAHRCFESFTEL